MRVPRCRTALCTDAFRRNFRRNSRLLPRILAAATPGPPKGGDGSAHRLVEALGSIESLGLRQALDVAQDRAGQVRFGEVSAADIGAGEISAAEFGAIE